MPAAVNLFAAVTFVPFDFVGLSSTSACCIEEIMSLIPEGDQPQSNAKTPKNNS
jgi:hypothetical protein